MFLMNLIMYLAAGAFFETTEAIKMKFGMRTPSIKKSIKARTTGKAKRAVKKALIPGYGKKVQDGLRIMQTLMNSRKCME